MVERKLWETDLRYWLYAGTVGALVRTVNQIDKSFPQDAWVTSHLCGVFEDVKDEYKRRVNPAYETAQIKKSGDCYGSSYRTTQIQLKGTNPRGEDVSGWVELSLPQQKIEIPRAELWRRMSERSPQDQ